MQVTNKLNILLLLLLLSSFTSCESSFEKVSLHPYELFHDNSSKVWVLDSQFENNIDKTPLNKLQKWVIIFFDDRTFSLTTLEKFAQYTPYQGKFIISENNDTLIYKWNSGQIDKNNLIEISPNKLTYSLQKNKNTLLKMNFVPVKKINSPPEIDVEYIKENL